MSFSLLSGWCSHYQDILAEKIKEENERTSKLNKEASIERLEALIEPITQHLNFDIEHPKPIGHKDGKIRNIYKKKHWKIIKKH